uniref:NADH-ubiquinone oxidoreductase chain 3 n=1 Tax=Sigalphus bicolor TaxID=515846 RepID=A0A0A6ZKY2_9HYME|nr:NADH dehydrogenase subunit 3 [Sigalphus bicolor]
MLILLIFFFLIFLISLKFLFMSYLISKNKFTYFEKLNSFECGFTPLESSRLPFSINFYVIGILFLIFDVEIILLIPFINSFKSLNLLNWLIIKSLILFFLLIGLEYEKFEGSLKWLI